MAYFFEIKGKYSKLKSKEKPISTVDILENFTDKKCVLFLFKK